MQMICALDKTGGDEYDWRKNRLQIQRKRKDITKYVRWEITSEHTGGV